MTAFRLPVIGGAVRIAAAIGVAAALGGCAAGHPDLIAKTDPADVAAAICRDYHREGAPACSKIAPAGTASEEAYALCLDGHPGDRRACGPMREAYEADLRALFAEPVRPPPQAVAPRPATAGSLTSARYRELHKTAEDLYVATSRDAQTFEAALLIPDVRRKVAAVLGSPLGDAQLRGLAAKARAEALDCYEYMQGLERLAPPR
jgi:hypothetical protein